MAAKFGTTPSRMQGLTRRSDAWVAWQYDSACHALGQWAEGKLGEMTGGKKPKAKHTIQELIGGKPKPGERRKGQGRMKIDASMIGQRV